MNRSRDDAVRAILGLLLIALSPTPGLGQAGNDPLDNRRQELRALKQEMEENRRKIEDLQQKEKDLDDLGVRIRRDRNMTARYIGELERQERALLRDLALRRTELDARTVEHEAVLVQMRRRLRAFQRTRQPHAAELILSSRSFAEIFSRGTLLARAIRRSRDDLLWLRASRDSLERETSTLQTRRMELDTLQEEKRREKSRLDQKSTAALEEIAGVRRAREKFERRQKELAESEKKIQSLIAEIEKARLANQGIAGPGLGGRKGRLAWPAKGETIERFGIRTHPRFKTKVPSKGIDIAAPGGTPITAVAPGIAEFVDWLPGYGRCVILNHGEGYYTLYAHCRRILVAKGQSIVDGQRIAEVGDTDSIRGNCLHFEIRHQEKALNPEEWLR